MADDCEALGFEMDSGDAFSKDMGKPFMIIKNLTKL
jgi:hypothetical protein